MLCLYQSTNQILHDGVLNVCLHTLTTTEQRTKKKTRSTNEPVHAAQPPTKGCHDGIIVVHVV